MNEWRAHFRIAADHPSLPGHFPGQPVVPGVVMLDRVAALLEREAHARIARMASVKFLAPLLPDQNAEIVASVEGLRARFRVEREGAAIMSGEAELA